MRDVPLALQTSYADLLDKLLDEAVRPRQSPDQGSFVVKTIKERRYWYWQDVGTPARKQHYLGAETPDLLARIANHRSIQQTTRLRRDIVRSLTGSGAYVAPVTLVGKVLEALADAGVFRLRAVLVGTVAFSCYGAMFGRRLRSASLMTSDIDIAQFPSISIAVEDRIPPLLDVLRAVNPAFRAITLPLHDTEPVSYAIDGGGSHTEPLKVEFLAPMRGPERDGPQDLRALDTSAQSLRFLDYLIYGERKAAMLFGSGVLVNVPDPARFAWHKCIVAERRRQPEKVSKDLAQAEALFEILLRDRPDDLRDMYDELAGPGRVKWQQIARNGLARIEEPIRQQVFDLIR